VTSSSAGKPPRRPDLSTQRHAGAEPDALKPHLIHQPAKQPQPAAANGQRVGIGVGWRLGWQVGTVIQHRRLDHVDVDHHLDRLPPRDPYRMALVAASLRARTTSSAASPAIPAATPARLAATRRDRPGREAQKAPWHTPFRL
jgi:hypothetical protein